jgi:hypothetical protein
MASVLATLARQTSPGDADQQPHSHCEGAKAPEAIPLPGWEIASAGSRPRNDWLVRVAATR